MQLDTKLFSDNGERRQDDPQPTEYKSMPIPELFRIDKIYDVYQLQTFSIVHNI